MFTRLPDCAGYQSTYARYRYRQRNLVLARQPGIFSQKTGAASNSTYTLDPLYLNRLSIDPLLALRRSSACLPFRVNSDSVPSQQNDNGVTKGTKALRVSNIRHHHHHPGVYFNVSTPLLSRLHISGLLGTSQSVLPELRRLLSGAHLANIVPHFYYPSPPIFLSLDL